MYAVRIAHVQGPVKVLWSREEDIQHDKYRPFYVDRIAVGLDGKGNPVSWMHTIAGSTVSAVYSGEPLKNGVDDDAVDAAADPVYAFPNLEVRYVQEEPTGVPTWAYGVRYAGGDPLPAAWYPYCSVHKFVETNMYANCAVNEHLDIHGSVTNLFNANPPVDLQTYGGGGNLPYDAALHQDGAVGRYFTLGTTYRF